ncbi:MAG: hypothetical protein ACOYMM_01985 [Phycisphaerales bacterium]|jgi:hypothetical protein
MRLRAAILFTAAVSATLGALSTVATGELVDAYEGRDGGSAPRSVLGAGAAPAPSLGGESPWTFEFEQSAWSPLPSVGAARAAVTELRARPWQSASGRGIEQFGEGLNAYDLDAAAWWNRSVGAVISARVIDEVAEAGPQALLADVCGALRVVETPKASFDLLAGARIAAGSESGVSEADFLDVSAYESESAAIFGFRAKSEVARGFSLALRGDVSPRTADAGLAWTLGGGVRFDMGDDWTLSVDAGWRTLDAALIDTLNGGGAPNDFATGDAVGAVWFGLSKSY